MVVNSLGFLLFFVVVFIVYYLPLNSKKTRFQNAWLFLCSYFFYGFVDWKMIPLLLGTTVVFYGIGLLLKKEIDRKKKEMASWITTLGVFLGVSILFYFKYLNFFADSFVEFLNATGINASWNTLNIILPIGVSFFVFKLISYVIEIHREHIEPCRDFVVFGSYIAFFPTIMSGPIDRPNAFIPQLEGRRNFNYDLAVDGCRQIMWGMFTKMCIADHLAIATDEIWNTYTDQNSSTLLLMALLYYVQLYADFDGYSNMAIGVGKILGFNVTRNFNHPFLARNMAEYWRRWHISLTSWITDYVFMPLNIAFRECGNLGVIMAVIINLILIGLWHGANWTFGLFGFYHGLLFIPLVFSGAFGKKKRLKTKNNGLPMAGDLLKMMGTFCLVSLGLIFFRANSVSDAFAYIAGLLSMSVVSMPNIITGRITLMLVVILMIVEWYQRDKEYPLQISQTFLGKKKWLPLALDYIVIVAIIICGNFEGKQFVYFQF